MRGFKWALSGAILLYFVIGLEIVIMISPFAAFFYAAFNPFLLSLAQHPATRWLAAFFLPHMIMPSDPLLQVIRVAGSVFLLGGAAVFFACAAQVYAKKFLKKGVASGGLYSYIRHPQYLGLAVTGLGLSILWPRFLVTVLWSVMLALYYFLARDEEKRMLRQYGDGYGSYMEKTGMFLPRSLEKRLTGFPLPGTSWIRGWVVLGILFFGTLGTTFGLRVYTIHTLPKWSNGRVTVVPIMPAESMMLDHRMADILEMPEIKNHLQDGSQPYLVYFMHPEYIMQGMIADTGGEWRLYMQHKTLPMIWDWVIHPFSHLQGGHHMMHIAGGNADTGDSVVRRLIFLRVETDQTTVGLSGLFGINSQRVPAFYADVDVHNLVLKTIQDLPAETGWGRVPTPMF
jgi:protein-S-isoprenylcysteine O-methyltransferase Ste14